VKIYLAVALIALSTAAVAVPALAQGKPRTIEDCERIDEPLAYNACLASFGPKRGEPATSVEEAEPAEAEPAKPTPGRQRGATRGRQRAAAVQSRSGYKIPNAIEYGRTSNGRAYAVFDVGAAKPSTKRKRRR
jgi:hypothetical protein